jgi:endosialidase-like protein
MNRHTTSVIATTAAILFMPILALAQSWSAAPASPPSNNAAAPINVSSATQAKTGSLSVGGTFYSAQGIGIGVSPYDTNGSVNALKYCINSANCITSWPAVGGGGTVTQVNSGTGLTGGPITTTGTLTVDTSVIQSRVTGTCSGQVMVGINTNGTVSCEADDTGVAASTPTFDQVLAAGNSTTRTFTAGGATFTGNVDASNKQVKAGVFLYASDQALKSNIKLLPNALEKILQINGVSFNWKDTGRSDIGVIAQNVEKVYPELVSTDSKTGLKSVEYGNLVGPLIEAVKAQQKEIDALRKEIDALKR